MPGTMAGIVGGLGPWAHVDLEQKILQAAQRGHGQNGARLRDQDYPQWVLVSLPWTPDRTRALHGEGPSPVPALNEALARLEGAGADYAILACNTAHAYLGELKTKLPILDMIELCARRIRQDIRGGAPVGLLATDGTLQARVYHQALKREGLLVVTPLDLRRDGVKVQRELVMEPIYGPGERPDGQDWKNGDQYIGIKAGGSPATARRSFHRAARRLQTEFKIQALIAGCTEIPIALNPVLGPGGEWPALQGLRVYDPARLVAEEVAGRWTICTDTE